MRIDDRTEKVIKSLYTQNLAVRPGERVLIFTDTKGDEINKQIRNKPRELRDIFDLIAQKAPAGIEVKKIIFLSLGGHGKEPPEELWAAAFGEEVIEHIKKEGLWAGLLSKSLVPDQIKRVEGLFLEHSSKLVDVVIGLSHYSTSHTLFRKLLTDLFKARFASMPIFDQEMFEGAMTADWERVAERSKKFASLLESAERVLIQSSNGTDLQLGLKGASIHVDTGILNEPGAFGNLPAGEVYLAPEPGTTKGSLVLEWAPTWRLDRPITLSVSEGEVKTISGDDPYAEELRRFLEKDRGYRNIAELGIGTNDKASRPDNILESEKILGTIHIALGDNSSFGGKVRTSFHQDFVVFHPTVTLIYPGGKQGNILNKGRVIDAI